jgi:signal transduction histidine kinase
MDAKHTLKILCLEDDEEDFEIINYALEKGGLSYTSTRVDTKEKFLEALNEYNPDIILSDHSMPTFNSTEALEIRKIIRPETPFILVTGAVSDEFAVNCIKLGADDYILKSNLHRLASAINTSLRHKETEKAKIKAITDLAARNEQLLKINNELDSLVYSVSHNLRSPLTSVLGLVNLAKGEKSQETLNQYHEMIETSVKKLDDTVKEILDYSRNARQELHLEQVDLKSLIQESLDKLKFMSAFNTLHINLSIDAKAPFYSDYYRVSVVLANLISNSIKYLDQGKPESFLEIEATVDEKVAEIHVKDNGIGIDKQLLPKIFNMFFRATNRNEGSGLGLYIVKEAIEKLGGRIEIESELGKGTRFIIEIPNLGEKGHDHTDRSLENNVAVRYS